jgi:ribosomal protein L37E
MREIYMVRCPKCNKENYALNVASGECTWCGYVATQDDVDGAKVWNPKDDDDDTVDNSICSICHKVHTSDVPTGMCEDEEN